MQRCFISISFLKFLFLLMLAFSISTLYAEDKSAGCGLGSLAAPKQSLISTTTANVVDYFLPSKYSATTTGTSGCAQHSLVIKNKMDLHYTEVNYENLKQEIAMGGGVYTQVFGRTLGCNDDAYAVFSNEMQKNYQHIFIQSNDNSKKALDSVKYIIKGNPVLSKKCNIEA
ncbi:MAG: DUF3015 family protein [Oligoflexia bacterium]|nr:DUF3015 family protein [Oligoflexia bacterium]